MTHIDFVKLAKVHGLEAVDGWPDVLAISTLLYHLQLPHARDVGQPRLDLCHVWHLRRRVVLPQIMKMKMNTFAAMCLLYALKT